jgi:hypothetical protein
MPLWLALSHLHRGSLAAFLSAQDRRPFEHGQRPYGHLCRSQYSSSFLAADTVRSILSGFVADFWRCEYPDRTSTLAVEVLG